jgi:cytoskeletal protein CcmA (bactofilin family)
MRMLNTDRETQPSQSELITPGGQSAVNAPSMPSVISPELCVVGDLHCTGGIQIEGTVEGQITAQTVTIVEGARVSGPIHADTVRVSGSINGQIEGNAVILASTASVKGTIAHKTLSIEAGAQFQGQCSRLEKAINISGKAKIANPKPAEQKLSVKTKNVGSGDAAKLQSEIKERIEQ